MSDMFADAMISMLESRVSLLEARIEAADASMRAPMYAVSEGMPGFGDGGGAWTVDIEGEGEEKKVVVKNCYIYISRKLKMLEDYEVPEDGGCVCVKITHEGMEAEVEVTDDESSDDFTIIPIFELDEDGEIVTDYRRIPFVQFYE